MFDATISRRNAMLAMTCAAKSLLHPGKAAPSDQGHPELARLAVREIQEAQLEPTLPYTRVAKGLSLAVMRQALQDFSPLVWLCDAEAYRPCSVGFAFANMERYLSTSFTYKNQPAYCLQAKDSFYWPLYPSYFAGQDYGSDGKGGSVCEATCYAFFVDKSGPFTDLTYFFYYPFNYVPISVGHYGNHVGDWEYATVRICWTLTPSGWANPQPWSVYASAHDGAGNVTGWSSVEQSNGHPVIYAALGTHANYYTSGTNWHDEVLPDFCSQGTPWNTGNYLASFYWKPGNPDPGSLDPPGNPPSKPNLNLYTLTALNGQPVPGWMTSNQYWASGGAGQNPADPTSGPIYRWGNEPSWLLQHTNYDPPQGPLEKWEVWRPSQMG